MRERTLSPRLFAVAEWVPSGARVADVGTDHGFLPVWLLRNGRSGFVVATDLREGPLSVARGLVEKHNLETRCRLLCCDGLSGIAPGDADTLILAGMGGETISGILEAAPWTREGAHTLLLQPMSKAELLREFLAAHGYGIQQERLVPEGETLYHILKVRGGYPARTLTPVERYGSASMWQQETPMILAYLDRLIGRLAAAAAGLGCSRRPESEARLRQITEELSALQEKRRYLAHDNHSADL